jgi:hypothetical protein
MHRLSRLLATGLVSAVLVACSSPAAAPTGSGATSPSPQASDAAAPSSSADAATVEPVPPDELGEFSCDLPAVEQATTARANIVDVRTGTHADGYDRVVFEFVAGTPEVSLDRAEPPFTQDASGLPIEVEGESFLRLTMRGGTKQMEDGSSSYSGSRDFDPDYPMLVDLIEGGDFEAQSTWYLGLRDEACVRVMLLDDEPRLVIDVQH